MRLRLRHIYGGYISADVFKLLEYDFLKFLLFTLALAFVEVLFYTRDEDEDGFFEIALSGAIGVGFWCLGGAYAT